MAVQANGTDAKDIALHFMELCGLSYIPARVARNVKSAKDLLEQGYTKEQIMSVIQHVIFVKKVDVYSFGYIYSCIEDVLYEIEESAEKAKAQVEIKEAIKKQTATIEQDRKRVIGIDESTTRNRQKAGRFDPQSRLREKYNFDMFEGK